MHRATLHDGRDVAVKVQYPGIAEAIHADLQNLRLGLRLLSAIAPGIDTGEIATEIRERISEELDYELEATHQRAMARIYRGHPFIHVPQVMTELCRERVLVSEFVDGERLPAMKARPSPSATAPARSSCASTSTARCAIACSTATRIPATACSSPTAASPSWTSASASA